MRSSTKWCLAAAVAALVVMQGIAVSHAALLADPTIIDHATEYDSGYLAEYLLDETFSTRYASQGLGVDTFVDFDFGSEVTIGSFKHIDRTSGSTTDQADLIFSNDSDFSTTIATRTIDHVGTGDGTTIGAFNQVTARYVRWDVTAGSACAGGREMDFFSPVNLVALADPTIIDSATEYDSGYLATNLLDENNNTHYASLGCGVDTFVDFDFGSAVSIAGFKHIDRNTALIDQANLIFSNDSDFSNVISTVSVDHVGTHTGTTSVSFDPITARYVRLDVTELVHSGYTTVGGREVDFFTVVPEPSTLVLLGIGALALLVVWRRRR